jgi:hypothetical protein
MDLAGKLAGLLPALVQAGDMEAGALAARLLQRLVATLPTTPAAPPKTR